MAFPTTVTSFSSVGPCGPCLSSVGNVYAFGLFASGTNLDSMRMFKATDPTSSFSSVGTDVTVTGGNTINGTNFYQVGDVIHIVTYDSVNIRYHKFDMSSDSWTTSNELIVTPTTLTLADTQHVHISLRSGGDVIVFYNGTRVANMGSNRDRIYYARKVSGTWTVDVAVDNGGASSYYTGGIVLGASDRHHLFFHLNDTAAVYQRCLRSANTLETFPSSFDSTVANDFSTKHQGISYSSGGTTKVRHCYVDATNAVASGKCDSADTPTMSSDADITGATNARTSEGYNFSFSANGTDLWHTFIDSNQDIFTQSNSDDGGWSTPASFYTGTVTELFTQVYTRGGDIVLGILFIETSIKYTEKLLTAGDTTPKDIEWDCQFGFSRGRARR